MQHKKMFAFSMLVLFSLLIAPIGVAAAQPNPKPTSLECPPMDSELFQNRDLIRSLPPECAEAYQELLKDANTQDVSSMTIYGPDDSGYAADDSVALSWIDTTSGTDLGLAGGDGTGSISLPFPFKFYENTYNDLYIAASGYLTFTNPYYYWPNQQNFPSPVEPNNLIAPYFSNTYVGTGWVHYMSGGSAPNRYFVVEWHDVKGGASGTGADETYRYEVILHENGDIVFQYQTMTYNGTYYCGESGIEDSSGSDGLSWTEFCGYRPTSNTAIRFYRPPAAARVSLTPVSQGNFAQPGAEQSFEINVFNTGELGTDTYDLTEGYTQWEPSFYAADGITPLTDTDSDSIQDTGPIPQSSSVTIIAKVTVPVDAVVGDESNGYLFATSSIDTDVNKVATLQSAVPTSFAQVYVDGADGAMSIELVLPQTQSIKKATSDWYYGDNMAVTATPNGNFIYAWSKFRSEGSVYVGEIEYTVLDNDGNTLKAVSKLTDNTGAVINTYDTSPSVAVAPNGTIGLLWRKYTYSAPNYHYNIYFVTLDASGNLLTGPINITNNITSGVQSDLDVPYYFYPTIAAMDDNRFILSWDEYIGYGDYIWYAVRDTAGANIFSPTALTNDGTSWEPVLNSLTNGKAIITWLRDVGGPYYAVINSSGVITKTATTLSASTMYWSPDAVLLPNGKVAVAWGSESGVEFAILNSSYILESGPISASSPSLANGEDLSVTTDSSSRVIMTWLDTTLDALLYALGDSTGNFITPPMVYHGSNTNPFYTGYNGQSNAPYIEVFYLFLPLILR